MYLNVCIPIYLYKFININNQLFYRKILFDKLISF